MFSKNVPIGCADGLIRTRAEVGSIFILMVSSSRIKGFRGSEHRLVPGAPLRRRPIIYHIDRLGAAGPWVIDPTRRLL